MKRTSKASALTLFNVRHLIAGIWGTDAVRQLDRYIEAVGAAVADLTAAELRTLHTSHVAQQISDYLDEHGTATATTLSLALGVRPSRVVPALALLVANDCAELVDGARWRLIRHYSATRATPPAPVEASA